MSEQQFSGFPEETFHFFSQLADNNNREWFNAHKEEYQDYLVKPAVAFVAALGPRLQFVAPNIQYDTRANGQGSMMRIYRDTRFSKDKTPYKSWLGFRFWEGSGKKTELPGFFFGIDAGGGGIHAGMYGFPKPILDAYRAAVVDDKSGKELESALAAVQGAGPYGINSEHYKRVPRGFDKEHPRAGLLRFNALYFSSPKLERAHFTSPQLIDICMTHCENMAPLHRWLVKLHQ